MPSSYAFSLLSNIDGWRESNALDMSVDKMATASLLSLARLHSQLSLLRSFHSCVLFDRQRIIHKYYLERQLALACKYFVHTW